MTEIECHIEECPHNKEQICQLQKKQVKMYKAGDYEFKIASCVEWEIHHFGEESWRLEHEDGEVKPRKKLRR